MVRRQPYSAPVSNAIGDLEQLDLDRYPTLALMRRAYQVRHNLTAYDATYMRSPSYSAVRL